MTAAPHTTPTELFDLEFDDEVRTFIDSLGDDARCHHGDGAPATFITTHDGKCPILLCGQHAEVSRVAIRRAIEQPEMYVLFCEICDEYGLNPATFIVREA